MSGVGDVSITSRDSHNNEIAYKKRISSRNYYWYFPREIRYSPSASISAQRASDPEWSYFYFFD